ncbi:UDP-galactopyranose mutase [Rickettsia endosymbiont of Oedothorax gibbosus]|uniref:UDP-galactopyranose mutase n=1 Tax=Rickettsia endosymbiont of Oedothorax gibbosus TaxID=931099 RepID=UPI002023E621|nr:UDP-galactopyranose mutase [Rickettsia endosymbiont of Oedothorax gibbosus]
MIIYDYIIVGSGFAGSILAERIASQLNQRVLVIEKRPHIAGNMYDYKDVNNILVHKYGPHLFRTNEDKVKNYLSNFTHWYPYQHKVLAKINDQLVPVPFNLTSLELLLPVEKALLYKDKLIVNFGMETKVSVSKLRNFDDGDIRALGDFIFETLYLNYTVKQWGDKPENLDFETITARVPVHISYDDRYFQQSFQALPVEGYTAMFEKMLSHDNIDILLNIDSKDLLKIDLNNKAILFKGQKYEGNIIYTGPIDELFNYHLGELPYRSLKFTTETHDEALLQRVTTVNYPNTELYTRITEYNHTMRVPNNKKTVLMYEYPQEYDRTNPEKDIPYYPIPKDCNSELFNKYKEIAKNFSNLRLIGRLAEYRYYDMDDIILRALKEFEDIESLTKITAL